MPQWFLIGILILTTVFVVNQAWAARNDWFANRSSEFTSLAPHLRLLFELGRDVGKGDEEMALLA
jgi:hypothetical protein